MNDYHPNAPGSPGPDIHRTDAEIVRPALDVLSKSSISLSSVDLGVMRMETDLAMEFALRHKREIKIVVEQIKTMALHTDASANRCIYALPRAEKAIIGPSIGLATIVATAWGNCFDRGWWVRTDRNEKVVVCEGMFRDLQTNRTSSATVTRRISGKSGRLYSDDMVAVTIQAATSIAQRNAIFKGVPDPIWRPIYEEALIVVRGTAATLPERRAKMIESFAQFGVSSARVFSAMGVREEREITLDQMVVLRGMYEQLRDEVITADEMFDPRRMTGAAFEAVGNPLADDEGGTDTGAGEPDTSERRTVQGARIEGTDPKPATVAETTQRQEAPGKAASAPEAPAATRQPAGGETERAAPPGATLTPSPASGTSDRPTLRTGADYLVYLAEWAARATTVTALDERFKRERELRSQLARPLTEDELDQAKQIKAEAETRLRSTKQ
jgi:hypothetical protein